MKYSSLNYNSKKVGFLDAVIKGLAPDRGLYFPEKIPILDKLFISSIENYSNNEIAFKVIEPFIGNEIPKNILQKIIEETLSFDFPLVKITENISTLELFKGPTLAFKDVGARFMARCLSYGNKIKKHNKITVLVATSGDTGGAVADGFYKVKGIDVIILFPKGKVSKLQELQLTTLNENITAIEIDGTFDQCQDMVKSAFIDPELIDKIKLTSANSINIARWLSQMFYYFIAFKNRPNPTKKLVISVPSGNFGNICAGIISNKMGLPINHFIASTNSNDTVLNYLNSGNYIPKKSIQTISNAMDVGDPSNFIRIQKIFNNDLLKLKKTLSSYSYSDKQTESAIKEIFSYNNYIADPHGAIGFLGIKDYLISQEDPSSHQGIFLETAHPIKFANIVERIIDTKIELPSQIKGIRNLKSNKLTMVGYNELKSFLLAKN